MDKGEALAIVALKKSGAVDVSAAIAAKTAAQAAATQAVSSAETAAAAAEDLSEAAESIAELETDVSALKSQIGTVPTGNTVEGQITNIKNNLLNINGIFSLIYDPQIVTGYGIKPAGNGVVADANYNIYRYNVVNQQGRKIHLNLNSYGSYCSACFSTGTSLSSTFISLASDGDVIPNTAIYINVTTQAIENDRIGIYYNALEMVTHGKLYGRKIYACGDSITKGANNNDVSYITKIARRNNMTLTNYSISGSTIVKTELTSDPVTYRGCVQDQVDDMVTNTEPDYVILSGGYNDSQSSILNTIGTVKAFDTYAGSQDAYTTPFDTSTVVGGIESMIRKINQIFPHAKLLYVITYKIVAAYHWYSEYVPAIKSALEKWSVPYVDLSENGRLINDANLWQRTAIFTDGTHPNNYGYEVIADIVEERLRRL